MQERFNFRCEYIRNGRAVLVRASAAFQAAQSGWVNVPFEPITFQEPVQIVLKPTASATGLPGGAGTIWSLFEGVAAGVN